ncbi:hypothetical protein PM082_011010 [Marasmius tenuissimus]|nr:hypothetical protein PM082_011010 [Marasmius tenuissimus]
MEEQFQELVLQTFTSYPPRKPTRQNWSRRVQDGWSKGSPLQKEDPDLVIIDGLDECSDEKTQLRIVSTIQSAFRHSPHFPLRFLICSRPEAWLQEAFAAKFLRQLSEIMVLDESFSPSEDIMQYYLHHFQEITHDPKYKHVQFPSPWPSKADLEALVIRTCGQFVYAITVIKFIMGAFKHPIEQLRIILEDVPPRLPGASPYRQLDTLYDYILGVNPDYEEVLPILAAIPILPDYLKPTPTNIELLFGLRAGQVALPLRAMYSVLDIRGSAEPILVFHTSFSDYLVQQTRSHRFHIDIETQKHVIARCWLQNLTTSKVQTYRYEVNPRLVFSTGLVNDLLPHMRVALTDFMAMNSGPSSHNGLSIVHQSPDQLGS